MKKIRRPLTDVYWRDFMTWEQVEPVALWQDINKTDRIEKWLIQKIKESDVDWKIYIEWLWYVWIDFIY